MSDLLKFDIWPCFFLWMKHSKIFVISVEECMDALKLAHGERIALVAKW